MRCEDAIETIRAAGSQPGADLRPALDHAAECDDCQAALRALNALRTLRDEPAPMFDEAAIERAIDKALTASPAQRYRRGFWSGLASGAALAATVAALAVSVWLWRSGSDGPIAVPEVRLALNQRSDVTVTLESPEPLAQCRSSGRASRRRLARWLRGPTRATLVDGPRPRHQPVDVAGRCDRRQRRSGARRDHARRQAADIRARCSSGGRRVSRREPNGRSFV